MFETQAKKSASGTIEFQKPSWLDVCKYLFISDHMHDLIVGSGSSGWQAPEQLLHGRQTRAVDLFSLGCVLFFCITGGRHPFGDRLERDINIVKNQMDLFLLEDIPEAIDLISHLLNPDPELRLDYTFFQLEFLVYIHYGSV